MDVSNGANGSTPPASVAGQATLPEPGFDPAELVERHLPLVGHVLRGVTAHFPRHADREELAQAARLGLVEAANRYDPARGVPFERWAALRIRGAILDAVRAADFAPRTLRSALRAAEQKRSDLEQELGRTPTTAERASRLGMSVGELTALEGRAHRALVVSLDAAVDRDGDDERSLAATLVSEEHPDPLALLLRSEQAQLLREAVAGLPDRLRDVVVSYFIAGESSAGIARRLRVTESRVSQMRTEALGLLRAALRASDDETPAPQRHADFAAAVARRNGKRLTGGLRASA